jgi:hypothetical protein
VLLYPVRVSSLNCIFPNCIPGGNRSQFGKEDIRNMKNPTTHNQGMLGVTLDDLCSTWNFPLTLKKI